MLFSSLFLFSFVYSLPSSGSSSGTVIGSIPPCPRNSCTRFDVNNAKVKGKCVRTDGTIGCIMGAIWSGSTLVYCTPDTITYPKFANGC